MGKRTRSTGSENYEVIAHKIRKLEQQLKRARRKDRNRRPQRLSSSSSSDNESSSSRSSSISSRSQSEPRNDLPSLLAPPNNEGEPMKTISGAPGASSPGHLSSFAINEPMPSTSAAANDPLPGTSGTATTMLPMTSATLLQTTHTGLTSPQPSTSAAQDQHQVGSEDAVPQLDTEILEILGEDPSLTKLYGKDIQQDLAIRLQHIATTGLNKEARKELLDRYLPPANCALIDAPTLNPEIAYAITDAVQKRDKGLVTRQKQQASALSCISEALTQLMSSDTKNTVLIKLLMDAAKLICDNQATDSAIRRNFILNGLKKDLKDQLQATKIDKMLFGEKLTDTLKAAKAISRSGSDMKPAAAKQPVTKKPPQNLNWRAPPPSQRPKGTQRKEPFPHKDRPASSSKRSSRPAKNRNHNYR